MIVAFDEWTSKGDFVNRNWILVETTALSHPLEQLIQESFSPDSTSVSFRTFRTHDPWDGSDGSISKKAVKIERLRLGWAWAVRLWATNGRHGLAGEQSQPLGCLPKAITDY
jgi:hypothetical protein